MSEFVPVVTEGMILCCVSEADPGLIFNAMTANPDFQRQLRAYVAEQMRGLVPGVEKPVTHGGTEECKADAFNDCRAETLANIAKWESSNGQ